MEPHYVGFEHTTLGFGDLCSTEPNKSDFLQNISSVQTLKKSKNSIVLIERLEGKKRANLLIRHPQSVWVLF